ncbi:MAG: Hpt domain-containing protein [Clostridiales bacterium]|nr:Hpt domain-containing protein [Clostridiales bacterium]
MDNQLKTALLKYETDLDGVKNRFMGDEELYSRCLSSFLQDPTMSDLEKAINENSWEAAFTATHALKGLAGNMGFVPLFHTASELVVLIRTGRISEVGPSYSELKKNYSNITNVIKKHHISGENKK